MRGNSAANPDSSGRCFRRLGFVLDVEPVVQEQLEAVHRQAQVGKPGLRRLVRVAGLQALGGPMTALTQGAVFVRVAQLPQEPPDLIGAASGLFDHRQGGGERRFAGLRSLEKPALERAALPRPVRVQRMVCVSVRVRRLI